MNKISKYILKEFISFLWYILVSFAVIFILVDLVENADKFIDGKLQLRLIALYYFFYLPYILILTIPVAMLLATMFSLGRLAGDNEITALKSSGVSLYRILIPLYMFALAVGIVVLIFAEFIVPKANIYREEIKTMRNDFTFSLANKREQDRTRIYLANSDGRIVYAQSYKSRSRSARGIVILKPHYSYNAQGDSAITGIVERIDADYMRYSENSWIIHDAVLRKFSGDKTDYEKRDTLDGSFLSLKPTDFARIELEPEEMDYFQLRQYIKDVNQRGGDASEWLVDLYMKLAFPFVSFVIVFFGAPMTAGSSNRGKTAAFGIALAISFTFYALINASQVLGRNGALDPVLSAWAPNVLFLIFGMMMLIRAKK